VIFDRGYGKNTGHGLFLVREILSITGMTNRETRERLPVRDPRPGRHLPAQVNDIFVPTCLARNRESAGSSSPGS